MLSDQQTKQKRYQDPARSSKMENFAIIDNSFQSLIIVANVSTLKLLETVVQRVFCKKSVLKNFTKFTGKHLSQSLFFNKVSGPRVAFLLKKTLVQVFSCEFCEIIKNTFLYRTPPVATSELCRIPWLTHCKVCFFCI